MSVVPNTATVRVSAGPLVAPVFARVVAMVAARADCPVDRLEDALLITDGLAAHGARHGFGGRAELRVDTDDSGLRLVAGPFPGSGGASAVLRDAEVPGLGNVVERLADSVEIETSPEGECLVLALTFERAVTQAVGED